MASSSGAARRAPRMVGIASRLSLSTFFWAAASAVICVSYLSPCVTICERATGNRMKYHFLGIRSPRQPLGGCGDHHCRGHRRHVPMTGKPDRTHLNTALPPYAVHGKTAAAGSKDRQLRFYFSCVPRSARCPPRHNKRRGFRRAFCAFSD